jgi:hypothetical protein
MIAQEVEEVVPEVIMVDSSGYRGIEYDKLVALLIEAVKDQQLQISNLRAEIRPDAKKR